MHKLLTLAVLILCIAAPNVTASSISEPNTQESVLDFSEDDNWQDTVEVDHPLKDNTPAESYLYQIPNPFSDYKGKDYLLPSGVTVSNSFSVLDVPGTFVDSWGNTFIGEDYYGHVEFLIACVKETPDANELILCRKATSGVSSLSIAEYLDMPLGYYYDSYNEYISLDTPTVLDIWYDAKIINDEVYRLNNNNELVYFGPLSDLTVGWFNDISQDSSMTGWTVINKNNGLQALPLFNEGLYLDLDDEQY